MGHLTTHVLDTAHGHPAAGVEVSLWRCDTTPEPLVTSCTNHDGRLDQPILSGEAFRVGRYELHFAAGDYFRKQHDSLPEPLFVDEVILRFGVSDADAHYHVPLLVSPWAWSTYRGS